MTSTIIHLNSQNGMMKQTNLFPSILGLYFTRASGLLGLLLNMVDEISMQIYRADSLVVIIRDYEFFDGDNIEAMDEWCWQTFGYHPRAGMIMTFREPSHTTWFVLKYGQ